MLENWAVLASEHGDDLYPLNRRATNAKNILKNSPGRRLKKRSPKTPLKIKSVSKTGHALPASTSSVDGKVEWIGAIFDAEAGLEELRPFAVQQNCADHGYIGKTRDVHLYTFG
jgi:hypothetical protein